MRSSAAITRVPSVEKGRRMRGRALWWCGALGSGVIALRALAHPSPAEPPTFADSPCVVVVDKREQAYLDINYSVLMDDTSVAPGDIPVADLKTHQFFAIAGTVYKNGTDDMVVAYTDTMGTGALLPLWVTHADVQRAAAASAMASGVTQDQTDLPASSVLETRADLDGTWLRITADDARRPITRTQSLVPVRWRLDAVPAGAYTLAGYVFSPPYNAWATRPGVVKVLDAEHDPPAGELHPINDVVFSYQGRRIGACLDVPPGTRLDAFYYVEEQPGLGWLPWLQDEPVQTGEQSFCFHTDRTDIAGSVRLRWDLRAPRGEVVTSLRSKDTLTWLQGSGDCQRSGMQCCDFVQTVPPPAAGAGAAETQGGAGAQGDAGTLPAAGAMAPAGVVPAHAPAASSGGGGCSVVRGREARAGLWFAALALFLLQRRRGRAR